MGAGHVGASFADTLQLSGLAAEIVLVDLDEERAAAEAMDLSHAVPFSHPTRIWAGDHGDRAGAVVTATNPVDVLAYEAWQLSGLPSERCSARGRYSTRLASASSWANTSG